METWLYFGLGEKLELEVSSIIFFFVFFSFINYLSILYRLYRMPVLADSRQ